MSESVSYVCEYIGNGRASLVIDDEETLEVVMEEKLMSSVEIHGLGRRLHDVIEREVGISVEDPYLDLLESGLLDSLTLLTIITAIERDFACELPLDQFDLDHFRSINATALFIDRLHRSGIDGWANVHF